MTDEEKISIVNRFNFILWLFDKQHINMIILKNYNIYSTLLDANSQQYTPIGYYTSISQLDMRYFKIGKRNYNKLQNVFNSMTVLSIPKSINDVDLKNIKHSMECANSLYRRFFSIEKYEFNFDHRWSVSLLPF